MKKNILAFLFIISLFAASCIDDKGSYDYTELADIKIEGIPSVVEVLGYVENITVSPKITSSIEGEIKADNPNYTFQYRLGYKGMGSLGGYDAEGISHPWVDVTPESGFDLDIPANYSANSYVCWFTVTDKRNNVVTSCFFDVIISSTTFEGWLVLCNEGTNERVRLDMISQISSTRIETIHDIAVGLPEIHHATSLGFLPQLGNPGDELSIFSTEGSYLIDNESLESSELMEFNLNQFALDPGETMIAEVPFPASTYSWQVKYRFAFSESGNVYLEDATDGGSAYGFPLNTTEAGSPAEFKVAPFAGFSWVRPWNGMTPKVVFYDIDNQRFVAFQGDVRDVAQQKVSSIREPSKNKLFSYSTGKDMVYMEGTRRSNGLVYAILEDGVGKRSIYGINVGGYGFIQELYIDEVVAPDFEQAEHFAFHSQFPLMFYAVKNKVYLYNLGTKTAKELTDIKLKDSETVTRLKFNLYRNSSYTSLTNQSEEFMNQQYHLIVASYDDAAADETQGGKVAFYSVDGVNDVVSKVVEYTGFANVVDVVYRERAQ
ncbi:PKD-like family lipoprotein [Butyricimonas faecalis]|jgi:hypothetical protein|uniref:DUF4623 domain-containing protein n=1 Tax=Butyricimonas faecalis TaxID=2093856 RepID=A0A3Q9IMS8_9BACT|nr:PKD-like family lipoprotein [Butyricimonas faecalis]AZS29487.1 hypothetical protein D8S85_07870 [Butyricimonas faecalis]